MQYFDYLLALAWFQNAYTVTLTVRKLLGIYFAISAKATVVRPIAQAYEILGQKSLQTTCLFTQSLYFNPSTGDNILSWGRLAWSDQIFSQQS